MKTSTSPLLRRAEHTLAALAVRRRLAWPLLALLLLLLASAGWAATTRTVTSLNDSGAGSLRETIAASGAGDTIEFAVSGAIVLTNGELAIGRSLTIVGPAAGVTVSGNNRGRVFNISGGTVVLSNLVVSSGRMVGSNGAIDDPNAAGGSVQGGGLLNSGSLSLINCTLQANVAVGGHGGQYPGGSHGDGGNACGGAICNFGRLTLLNCTFDSNSVRGGDVRAVNASFNPGTGGNAYGGAVYSTGMVSLVNCTLNRGSAFGGTGGFGYFLGGAGGNAAGGGLFLGGTATLLNTILSSCSVVAGLGGSSIQPDDPRGPNGSATGPDVSGAVSSQGHNLVGEADGSSGWVASDLTGTVATPLDPQLGPLQDNGGPVPTMALLPTSIAIDAGDDAVLSPPYSLSTDSRGFLRRTSDHVDIGAYEFSTITRLVTTTSDSGGGSLRNAIGLASPFDRIVFARIVRGTIRLTSGELLIDKPLSIVGPGAPVLAISGNTNSRVFHIGPQGNVEIYGLTITEGSVQAPQAPSAQPGTESRGAGLLNEASLRLFDCMLTTNKIQGGSGGNGCYLCFPQTGWGGPGGSGKGAAIYSSGSLTLTRCTLVGNRALGGDGGRGVDDFSPGWGGDAGAGEGGAVWSTAITRLENCTLADNRVVGGRGGNPGSDQFDNDARPGTGGNGLGGALHGPFVLESCTITGNAVTRGLGGQGYSLTGAPGAASGGGVNATGGSTIHNSIVARNTNSTTSPDINGSVTSLGWNLIGITDGSSGWTSDDFLGNSSFPLDALLSPCQDNGSPVWTICPLSGSPARDAGHSDLATDARGGPRAVDFPNVPNAPGGDGSDIGALEVDSLFGAITITKSNTFARVRFKSDPGTTYRLQQTSVVGNPVWTNVVGATMTGNGQNLEAGDPGPLPPVRFYRVRAD